MDAAAATTSAAAAAAAAAATIVPRLSAVTDTFWYPLLLSTLAGASTAVGGALAVLRRPDEGGLAFLLGAAIGVMATVSGAELWLRSAAEHGFWGVTAAVAVGAALFALLDPLLPKPPAIGLAGGGCGGADGGDGEGADNCGGLAFLATSSSPPGHAARSQGGAPGAGGSVAMTSFRPAVQGPAAAAAALEPSPDDDDAAAGGGGGGGGAGGGASGGRGLAGTLESGGGSDDRLHERLLQQEDMSLGGAAAAAGTAAGTATTGGGGGGATTGGGGGGPASRPATAGGSAARKHNGACPPAPNPSSDANGCACSAKHRLRHHSPAQLMRLGTMMMWAMAAHNAPEGFAVAFSADTALGPLMALAIAVHNVPEGVIIAAPIYAATGSRARAVGAAALSGLSEPLGALVALLVARPLLRSAEAAAGGGLLLLPYVLAAVGGVMLAVCGIELWPEARACQRDGRMAQGVLAGTALMGWTLYVGA